MAIDRESDTALADDLTFPMEWIRGTYAIRFEEILDAMLAVMKRHPRPESMLGDAPLRRRLHGIADGTIAATLSPTPAFQLAGELGGALYGLCDGSRQALADIRLTMFDELTKTVGETYPSLRLAVETTLVDVSYGWMLRDTRRKRQPAAQGGLLTTEELATHLPYDAALQVPRGLFVIDVATGDLVMFNPSMTEMFGYTLEEERLLSPEERRIDDSPEDDFDLVADLVAGRIPSFQRVGARPHKDGHPVWFHLLAWPIRNGEGEIVFIANLVSPLDDPAQRGQVKSQSDKRIRYLSRLSSDPIFIVGPEGNIRYASPSVERVLGYDPETLTGRPLDELVMAQDQEVSSRLVSEVLAAPRKSGTAEIRLTRIDGETPWFEVVASNLVDVEEVGGISLQGRDISKRKALEQQLELLASIDSLTGLLNRRGFLDVLDEALATLNPESVITRLVYIDLDNFKSINDEHGHLAGDDILMLFADRLRRVAGDQATVGRIGGDEFVILMQAENLADLARIESEIEQTLDLSCNLDGVEVRVRGTMGVAEASTAGMLSRELLQLADADLYKRKAGRMGVEFARRVSEEGLAR